MNESLIPKINEVVLIPMPIIEFKGLIREIIREEIKEIQNNVKSSWDTKPIRLKDAADYLGISPFTIYSYVHDGKLKPMKPGKHLLFTKESLDAYLRGERPEVIKVDPSEYLVKRKKKNFR